MTVLWLTGSRPPDLPPGSLDHVPSRRLRLLLVEDDPAIARMYALQFDFDGHEVAHAADGRRAFELLSSFSYDLALVDVRIPGMDGFDLLAAIRSRGVTTPVVFVSNYGEPQMQRRGRELGAVAYVVKSQVTPHWISTQLEAWASQGSV